MAPIAIAFGVLLTLLGAGLYFPDMKSITALIPSFFGIALIVLGVIARNERFRMHAMHVAALLGLVGFAFPAYRVTRALLAGSDIDKPIGGQIAMAVLCLIFLVLCVKSFIDARIARKRAAEAESQGK